MTIRMILILTTTLIGWRIQFGTAVPYDLHGTDLIRMCRGHKQGISIWTLIGRPIGSHLQYGWITHNHFF